MALPGQGAGLLIGLVLAVWCVNAGHVNHMDRRLIAKVTFKIARNSASDVTPSGFKDAVFKGYSDGTEEWMYQDGAAHRNMMKNLDLAPKLKEWASKHFSKQWAWDTSQGSLTFGSWRYTIVNPAVKYLEFSYQRNGQHGIALYDDDEAAVKWWNANKNKWSLIGNRVTNEYVKWEGQDLSPNPYDFKIDNTNWSFRCPEFKLAQQSNSADPFKALKHVIQLLKAAGTNTKEEENQRAFYNDKAAAFEEAIKKFNEAYPTTPPDFKWEQAGSDMTTYITSGTYLKETFSPPSDTAQEFRFTQDFYSFEGKDMSKTLWVDFANKRLGGGFATHGNVQEERMFMESPQLAELALNHYTTKSGESVDMSTVASVSDLGSHGKYWCSLLTREGGQGAGRGTPKPVIIENVVRVLKLNKDTYGRHGYAQWRQAKGSTSFFSALASGKQIYSTLAIAAPDLMDHSQKDTKVYAVSSTSMQALTDLYATASAGFKFATKHGFTNIHSGKLGAGAFGNDKFAVALLQMLAARVHGVRLTLHGYTTGEGTSDENLVLGMDAHILTVLKSAGTPITAQKYIETLEQILL